jgi:hypothetical protein
MNFVGYMLFVLILTMCRSYAHEREIFVKMHHYDHGYVTCLYVPIYLVGDACAPIGATLLVYVSILECFSALCILEKHRLAFVDLTHALPTRGGKFPIRVSMGNFASREKLGEMHLFRGARILHLGALFT